jgi:hypothetical protein
MSQQNICDICGEPVKEDTGLVPYLEKHYPDIGYAKHSHRGIATLSPYEMHNDTSSFVAYVQLRIECNQGQDICQKCQTNLIRSALGMWSSDSETEAFPVE